MYHYDRTQHEQPDRSLSLAVKIGIAVFVAIMAAAALRWAYVHWATPQFKEDVDKSIASMQAQSQAQLAALKAKEQQLMQGKFFEADRKRQEQEEKEARARREQALLAAREAAWEKFYKPGPECSNPRSHDEFVECGNAHHRAKVKFEEAWQAKSNH